MIQQEILNRHTEHVRILQSKIQDAPLISRSIRPDKPTHAFNINEIVYKPLESLSVSCNQNVEREVVMHRDTKAQAIRKSHRMSEYNPLSCRDVLLEEADLFRTFNANKHTAPFLGLAMTPQRIYLYRSRIDQCSLQSLLGKHFSRNIGIQDSLFWIRCLCRLTTQILSISSTSRNFVLNLEQIAVDTSTNQLILLDIGSCSSNHALLNSLLAVVEAVLLHTEDTDETCALSQLVTTASRSDPVILSQIISMCSDFGVSPCVSC